ncbi:MAG: DUF2169 domain-containing protein [Polyangiaceae bacterium]|nr:DUF2169 domain-containing protein [Polyangiaceae bacterium]
MEVASLSPLPVGVLPWNCPWPSLTVITKMTLAYGPSGFVLADEQSPFFYPTQSGFDCDTELYHPGDFAPRKAHADVMLTGSAFAPMPSLIIGAFLKVGSLEKRFFALASEKAASIPLAGPYLRSEPTSDALEVTVAPCSEQHPERARFAHKGAYAPHELENTSLSTDFDFGYYNSAPADQQTSEITPDLPIVLRGLYPGGTAVRGNLPNLWPRIFIPDASRGRGLREVKLACDTLWFDTDRSICELTFRGTIIVADVRRAPNLLISTLAKADKPQDLARVEARSHLAARSPAVRPTDLFTRPEPPVESVAELSDADVYTVDTKAPPPPDDEPTHHNATPNLPVKNSPQTVEISAEQNPLLSGLPFPSRGRQATVELRLDPTTGAVLPFEPPVRPKTLPFAPAKSTNPPSSPPPAPRRFNRPPIEHTQTYILPPEALQSVDPLPADWGGTTPPSPEPAAAQATTGPPVVNSDPMGAARSMDQGVDSAPWVARSIAAAEPHANVLPIAPPERVGLLSFEKDAAIQRALLAESSPLHTILHAHGVTELTWREHQRLRQAALRDEALAGGQVTALALHNALESARDPALAQNETADENRLDLHVYARIRMILADADDQTHVLAVNGIDLAKWEQNHRHYRREARRKPALAQELAAAMEAARNALHNPAAQPAKENRKRPHMPRKPSPSKSPRP